MENGIIKTSIILNSTKMLDGHIASYLNAKVKIFITSNPEPDVHALAKEVFDQLSELMRNFIETKLIDTEFAKTGSSYIDLFLKLDKPCDVLFLTKMKEKTDSGSRGINMMQTQITLEYLCKLLSVYLSNRSEVLFSYWGQSLGKKAKELLPGLQDVLGPNYFSSRDPIRIAGVQYSDFGQPGIINIGIMIRYNFKQFIPLFDIKSPVDTLHSINYQGTAKIKKFLIICKQKWCIYEQKKS